MKYYVIVDSTPRVSRERHFVTWSCGTSTNLNQARAFLTLSDAEKMMDALSLTGEEQYRIASVHKDERIQIDLI